MNYLDICGKQLADTIYRAALPVFYWQDSLRKPVCLCPECGQLFTGLEECPVCGLDPHTRILIDCASSEATGMPAPEGWSSISRYTDIVVIRDVDILAGTFLLEKINPRLNCEWKPEPVPAARVEHRVEDLEFSSFGIFTAEVCLHDMSLRFIQGSAADLRYKRPGILSRLRSGQYVCCERSVLEELLYRWDMSDRPLDQIADEVFDNDTKLREERRMRRNQSYRKRMEVLAENAAAYAGERHSAQDEADTYMFSCWPAGEYSNIWRNSCDPDDTDRVPLFAPVGQEGIRDAFFARVRHCCENGKPVVYGIEHLMGSSDRIRIRRWDPASRKLQIIKYVDGKPKEVSEKSSSWFAGPLASFHAETADEIAKSWKDLEAAKGIDLMRNALRNDVWDMAEHTVGWPGRYVAARRTEKTVMDFLMQHELYTTAFLFCVSSQLHRGRSVGRQAIAAWVVDCPAEKQADALSRLQAADAWIQSHPYPFMERDCDYLMEFVTAAIKEGLPAPEEYAVMEKLTGDINRESVLAGYWKRKLYRQYVARETGKIVVPEYEMGRRIDLRDKKYIVVREIHMLGDLANAMTPSALKKAVKEGK